MLLLCWCGNGFPLHCRQEVAGLQVDQQRMLESAMSACRTIEFGRWVYNLGVIFMAEPTTPLVVPPATQSSTTLATRTTVTQRGDDGIIRARYVVMDESVDDARANVAVVRLLSPENRALLLVDARTTGPMPPAVRSYYASEEAAQVIGALAVLVGSSASRFGANIMLRFRHPQIRTRLFTDETLAVRWLQSQLQSQRQSH
jgi:hypothetical protein